MSFSITKMDLIPITRLIQKYNNNKHNRFINLIFSSQFWNMLFKTDEPENEKDFYIADIFDIFDDERDEKTQKYLTLDSTNKEQINVSKYILAMYKRIIKHRDGCHYISKFPQFNYLFRMDWINLTHTLDLSHGECNDDRHYEFDRAVATFIHHTNFKLARKIIKYFDIDFAWSNFKTCILTELNFLHCEKSYIKFIFYYGWDVAYSTIDEYDQRDFTWNTGFNINKMIYHFIMEELDYDLFEHYFDDITCMWDNFDFKTLYFITKRGYNFEIEDDIIIYNYMMNKYYYEKEYYLFMKIIALVDKDIILEHKDNKDFKRTIKYLNY